MDHSKHTRLTEMEITTQTLAGAPVYDPDDAEIGKVAHLHGQGASAMVAVDVGGFLGIGSKTVLLPLSDRMDVMRDEDGKVHIVTAYNRNQLEEMPEHTD